MPVTVNTAAVSKRLTKKATVKIELQTTGTSDDAFLDGLIDQTSDFIVKETGRTFAKETVTETLPSDGNVRLYLSRRPVLSVSQVRLDGSTISSTKYTIDNSSAGCLFNEDGWNSTMLQVHHITSRPLHEGKRDWAVDYVAGFVTPGDVEATTETTGTTAYPVRTLPRDLERAAIDMVKTMFLRRDEDTKLKHQSVDDTFEILVDSALTPSTLRILERWRSFDIS